MTSPSKTRRSHERVWHKIVAVLTTESGLTVRGTTRDLSIRGICLQTPQEPAASLQGARGTLQLELPGMEDKSFACQIVYIRDNEMGIHILKFTDNFGFLLSQALFAESEATTRESIDWRVVHVRVHKAGPDLQEGAEWLQGQVLRLTSDWIEFCCPSDRHAPFQVGERIVIQLTTTVDTAYQQQMDGFIVEPLHLLIPKMGCPGQTVLKKVALENTPDANMDWLVGLLRVVHAPKIAAIMKTRALTNALLAGEENMPRKRSDTVAQVRRFFGHWFDK